MYNVGIKGRGCIPILFEDKIEKYKCKRKQARRIKKDKEDRKIMKEIIEADIATGAFKMNGSVVNRKAENGCYVTCQLKQEDMIKYICMSIGDVNKEIPMDFKDDFTDGTNLNNSFHKTISKVRKQYKGRVELERNIRISKVSMWFGIVGFIVSVIGLGLTIYTMVK